MQLNGFVLSQGTKLKNSPTVQMHTSAQAQTLINLTLNVVLYLSKQFAQPQILINPQTCLFLCLTLSDNIPSRQRTFKNNPSEAHYNNTSSLQQPQTKLFVVCFQMVWLRTLRARLCNLFYTNVYSLYRQNYRAASSIAHS